MSHNPENRIATQDDLARLLDLYRHLSPDDDPSELGAAQESFATFLRYPGSAILLREVGDVLVSSCTLVIVPNLTRRGAPYALIENVVTHQSYRGLGHAKRVLDEASDLAWAQGCYKVMLMTGTSRDGILQFYENCGFEQSKTGFQKRRLTRRREE